MRLSKNSLFVAILFTTLFCSCTPKTEPVDKSELAVSLPSVPYAFRSVLDDKPRILTLALSDALWVAYDTSSAQFYKAWEGNVKLTGPVYDNSHGPQPTSEGVTYYQNGRAGTQESIWLLQTPTGTEPIAVQYGGHKFKDKHLIVLYHYTSKKGWIVQVEERLSEEAALPQEPTPSAIFVRDFTISGLPANTQLVLSGMQLPQKYTLTGEAKVKAGQILFSNGQSRLKLNLTELQEGITNKSSNNLAIAEPKGLTLIKANDCGACHNDVFKTVGPSYQAIARRYQDTEQSIKILSHKIITGGSGIWGRAMMTPHVSLSLDDAEEIVAYILSLDDNNEAAAAKWNFNEKSVPALLEPVTPTLTSATPGALVYLHYFSGDMPTVTEIREGAPALAALTPQIHFTSTDGFSVEQENFAYQIKTNLHITKDIGKTLRLVSDDGAYLYVDGERKIDNWGFHATEAKDVTIQFSKGDHPLEIIFFQGTGGGALSLQWYNENTGEFDVIPASAFIATPNDVRRVEVVVKTEEVNHAAPGDTAPLAGVHPAFDIFQARPDSFEPMVGGIDFLPDGRMVVSTWDSEGSIYIVENFTADNPANIKVKRIAKGLAEPLGIQVVEGEIYVMQKQELTKLVDENGDDFIDAYITVANSWSVTGNFHEFGFGLVYREGFFYATLATAILPGGASASPQAEDRGKLMKINKNTGEVEFIAQGLRTPNGIGPGVGDGLFIADNQGDWLPSSKIVEVTPGAWYGSRSVDFAGTENLKEVLPVVWLPQDEINNSPSEPTTLNVGPYQNQMIFGDVTLGGIKRVYAERVNGRLQGVVFRFTQGLEAGVNRLDWAPDGSLIVGGVGNPGNWGQTGKLWYGLQRLVYNGKSAFEMLSVSARPKGFEIEFTEAIKKGQVISAENFLVQQWWYEPTSAYGGPKNDLKTLKIVDFTLSEDRKKVFIELDNMQEQHLVYFRIVKPFESVLGHKLWSTEAWYTLNSIPSLP